MVEAWDRVNYDPEIRVCILTGAGGYFCAGVDLEDERHSRRRASSPAEYDPSVIKALLKGFRLTKPLIAAVEGPAIAGGTEILQGTDIRVAGGVGEVRRLRGQVEPLPDGRLRRSGSPARSPTPWPPTCCSPAGTSRPAEAKEIGLIGHVVPDGQALLRTIRETEGMHEDEAFKLDTELGIKVFLSEDAKGRPEGVRRSARPSSGAASPFGAELPDAPARFRPDFRRVVRSCAISVPLGRIRRQQSADYSIYGARALRNW